MKHPQHRKAVAGWLRHPRYTQLYRWACRPVVEWFWQRVGDGSIKEKAPWIAQAKGALTAKLYDKALLIAVIYPFYAAVGYWFWTGHSVGIESVEIISAEQNGLRLLGLVPIVIPLFLSWWQKSLLLKQNKSEVPIPRWSKFFTSNLRLIGIAITGAGSCVFGGALYSVGADEGTVRGVVFLQISFASAVALAGSGAAAGAAFIAAAFPISFALLFADLAALEIAMSIDGTNIFGEPIPYVSAIILAFLQSLFVMIFLIPVGALAGIIIFINRTALGSGFITRT